MANFPQPPKIKTIFDEKKLKFTAPPIQKGAPPATFQIGLYYNNPQFTVFPGIDNGSGVKVISAGMDLGTFNYILDIIDWLATSAPNGEVVKIENMRDIPKEQRTDPKVRRRVATETLVGRDENGKIWICVKDVNKSEAPIIRFYIEPSYYHTFKAKMTEYNPGIISQAFARSWAKQTRDLMAMTLAPRGGQAQFQPGQPQTSNSGGGNSDYKANSAYSNKQTTAGAASTDDGFGDGEFDDF